MAKPQPKRIPSDGCAVTLAGETCYPHEGEWVELITTETVGELRARVQFAQIGAELDAIRGQPNQGRQFNEIVDRHYGALVEYLSRRVRAWNWTDDWGNPLPQPDGTPGPLLALRADEIHWLMNAVAPQESEAERKND